MTEPTILNTLQAVNQTASFNRMAWREEDMGQYAGYLHAGLIGAMLDTACGYAAATVAGRVLASHFSVNCLAPAVGRAFVARGRVVKAGRKQVFASAELYAEQENDELLLMATGNAILVPVELSAGSTASRT
jgi:uncharacterized protein (TIGR00369 family)